MDFLNFNNKPYWNNIYRNIKNSKVKYDLWLDKFKDILDKCKNEYIIDLGCGSGNNSLYLNERGFKVIACDFSNEALKIVKSNLPDVDTLELDITKKLPFENDSIQLIIADLSIHYFNEETTKNILCDIKRVLNDEGYFIFRVNSVRDYNYGAGTGTEIEKHFYKTESGYKRFFDEEDLRYFCCEWNVEYIEENVIERYGMKKSCFEVVLKK